jgi:hypothetical protein
MKNILNIKSICQNIKEKKVIISKEENKSPPAFFGVIKIQSM